MFELPPSQESFCTTFGKRVLQVQGVICPRVRPPKSITRGIFFDKVEATFEVDPLQTSL